MIGYIQVKERGATPRRMVKQMNAWKKAVWLETGQEFHEKYRDKRFTRQHARTAGYAPRQRRYSIMKRKTRYGGGQGTANPLQFTGDTRQRMRTARISSTSKGTRVRYNVPFYFAMQNPHTTVHPKMDFLKFTTRERQQLANFFDERLSTRMRADRTQTTETVT